MRTEFNKLRDLLLTTMIYDEKTGDCIFINVMELMNDLALKIEEVEKRIDCAVRSSIEANESIISLYTERIDNNESFGLKFNDHEIILRGTNDVIIALDLNNTEPIENNWYELFEPTIEDTVEDTVDISGIGIPYRSCYECSIKEEETVMSKVNNFWLCCDCNPQTELCKDKDKHEIVKDIISKLKDINVDGETMDYIVKELGFEEYLLRSLIMNSDTKDTKDLVREKFEISL